MINYETSACYTKLNLRDFFEIIEVKPHDLPLWHEAQITHVKKKFATWSQANHPDKSGAVKHQERATNIFQEVNGAFNAFKKGLFLAEPSVLRATTAQATPLALHSFEHHIETVFSNRDKGVQDFLKSFGPCTPEQKNRLYSYVTGKIASQYIMAGEDPDAIAQQLQLEENQKHELLAFKSALSRVIQLGLIQPSGNHENRIRSEFQLEYLVGIYELIQQLYDFSGADKAAQIYTELIQYGCAGNIQTELKGFFDAIALVYRHEATTLQAIVKFGITSSAPRRYLKRLQDIK